MDRLTSRAHDRRRAEGTRDPRVTVIAYAGGTVTEAVTFSTEREAQAFVRSLTGREDVEVRSWAR